MTTRRWLGTVAIIALAMGIGSFVAGMNRLSADRAAIARQHRELTREGLARRGIFLLHETPKTEYHARMQRKWLNGSNHPWVAIAPDPPEPPGE